MYALEFVFFSLDIAAIQDIAIVHHILVQFHAWTVVLVLVPMYDPAHSLLNWTI